MFEILKEYTEDYNLKVREISSVKPYFRKFLGISTKATEEFKNECIIVINANKGIYNNRIKKDKVKYWGSEKEWVLVNNEWKPIKSNKFLNSFNSLTDKVYIFLKNDKSKYIFLGEYKVTDKQWNENELNELYTLKPIIESKERDLFIENSENQAKTFEQFLINKKNNIKTTEKFIEILRNETNIGNLRKYEKKNFDFSKVIEKIAEYSKIHNEQIRNLKNEKIKEGYKCWEGKFSDLITEKNNQLTLYEFKTVHDDNFLTQFMKAVGQLEVYEKNLEYLSEFSSFNKFIKKRIVFLEVKELLYKDEYIKIVDRLDNISYKFLSCH
ncbi:hypothetical protein CG007_01650 [Mesoplasma entomophilum]|uniref:hypothetical protein n=1 Tax=Mesoplasma entomophilum TaxID=2149 RepID=UPI000D028CDA|nr:hypothetical protein [Mesoplasma entomophilum]AVN60320.1 hypothetical protein CG007_01650 [Mesoplasma entomophilum]